MKVKIKYFLERILSILKKIDVNYEIIFVLDPSKDNTEQLILENLNNNPKIKLIKLSRRFGQPAATFAGIHHAQFDNAVL